MQLGWIDFSRSERNKILQTLRQLEESVALDELGIGVIRDGYADILFPGISTLQTRAKYFVLLPYIFAKAEQETFKRSGDAKLYFTHGDDGNFLYVGSANASHKAFNENVEFLLKLRFRKYMMGYEYMLKDFLPDANNPFELVTDIESDEPAPDTLALDKAFRGAIMSIKGAEVAAQSEHFSVTIRTDGNPYNNGVVIAPLFRSGFFASLADGLVFGDMLLHELSEFFILRVEDKQAIIKIALKGMPEGRDQAIYKSIIQNKNGFLAYVSFMLSDDYTESYFEQAELAKRLMDSTDPQTTTIPAALYERMLRCAVNNPYRLLDFETLMSKLGDDMVSEEFIKMYQPFRDMVKRVRK